MSALSFCFESNQVRVLGTIVNPLFVALDICKALGFTNHRKAISDHVDPEDISKMEITTNGGKQEVNCVNESGMYALIFGSKLPSAKRFKKWVTSEVLPAIRKTGQYSATEKSSEVVPLTPRQQYKIQRAVAERAKGSHVHFNTIYKAIKIYFKVAKYDQIPASRFDECINFIQTVDLRIPEVLSDQPVEFPKPQLPSCPHCEFITRGNLQQASVKEIQQLTIDARNALAEMERERIRAWTCLHEIVFKLKVFA